MHRRVSANRDRGSGSGLLAAGLLAVFVGVSGALLQRPAEAQAPPAGTFASGGSLGGPRVLHAAALLNDGRVLIYGSGTSADLYDPATQRTEFLVTPTNDVIFSPEMVTLRDGRVLVVGGERVVGANQPRPPVATALLFDPQARTWSTVGPMTVARVYHTATLLADGRVLVVGGLDKESLSASTAAAKRTSEIFDPATGRFAASGTLPTDAVTHTASLLKDGRVLVSSDRAYLFSPAAGTFSLVASVPALRVAGTSTLLEDGTVLLVGGLGTGGGGLANADRFDPASGRFTAVGPLAQGRVFHTATLLTNGRVLVAGGNSGTGNQAVNTTEIFDPSTNQFTAGPAMARPTSAHTATAVADGRVVVTGGGNGSGPYASVEVFTPAAPAKPYAGSAPSAGSQSLLVTTRAANAEDLVKALTTDGCSARVVAYLQGGTWQVYLPGAPAVVNAAFPASLPATTPLFVGCN